MSELSSPIPTPMKTLTVTQYLETSSNPKRAAKRLKRPVKLFRHANRDLAHAECDLAHAKEDCLHTIEVHKNCLENTKQYLAEWTPDPLETETSAQAGASGPTDDEIFAEDFDEEDEEDENFRPGDHLEHAASDFKHAMKDASDALENLEEIDENLEELIDEAREEGFLLKLSEVRAEIARRAAEVPAEDTLAEVIVEQTAAAAA